jgi:cytochrome c oxidase subunit 3
LAVKAYEYNHKIQEGFFPGQSFHFSGPHSRGVEMFFVLYFTMTGLHVAVGVAVLTGYGVAVYLAQRPARLATAVDLAGLCWHFVDIVWVFLFPLFYLVGRAP